MYKYTKCTEVIKLCTKQKQTFLKRRDFYQKDNFINSVSKWCVQSKLLYNKGRFSILPLFLWQSIFDKDNIFESSSFFFFFFLLYLLLFIRCFPCRPKRTNDSFQANIKYSKIQTIPKLFHINSLHWQVIVYKGCRNK